MKKNTDIVIGLQWGDEGKGKIVDLLLSKNKYDLVIRANGGNNAGHSIKVGEKEFAVHSLPSGMLQDCVNIIGPGCVVNANAIKAELASLGEYAKGTLVIADNTPLILKKHIREDIEKESLRKNHSIGTTLKGIGPAYAALKNREAIFAGDLLDIDKTIEKFSYLPDRDKLKKELLEARDILKPFIKSIKPIVNNANSILIEGAQATMLDNLYGTYPFVTSSTTLVSGLLMGSGLNHLNVNKVYGVTKAYTTRVGNGPFVTEMKPSTAEKVRTIGKEIGVSTGRERRCGWIDLVQLKEAIRLNGVTDLCLIKSDVLDTFSEIKLCDSYLFEGEKIDYIPYNLDLVKPIYKEIKGWKEKTFQKQFDNKNLPLNLKIFIKLLETNLLVKVKYLSTGPAREETSLLRDN